MGASLIGDLQDWNSVFPLRVWGNGNFFFHEGSRRGTENGNGYFFLSAKGREGPRRTATATSFIHGGPLRTTENCNCDFLFPRRATKDHGELQLRIPFSAKGREGSRRTATATSFIHGGPLRTTENCNCNFLFSAKGREGARRTATATATSFVREGPLRTTENCNCNFLFSAKGREGARRTATATSFIHGGPLRTTENCNCNFLFSAKGREGARRTATAAATSFVHGSYLATVLDQLVIVGTIRALGDAAGVLPPPCSPAGTLRRRHTVGEAWFCRGALRGRSPCTREGRRPDRPYAKR